MKVFSFANLAVIINGVELTGWADGDDAIVFSRRNDSASDRVGAGGDMMVSLSSDKTGLMEFNLQQTSASNKYLTSLLELQENGADTFVPINVSCQDTYRQDRATGTAGYLMKPADFQRGAQGNNVKWSIVVEKYDVLLGDVTATGSLG